MSRLERLEQVWCQYPVYFVTACTYERQTILANATVHAAMEKYAANGPEHGAWLGAYVLMPDHLHLFVALDDDRIALSPWMKSLKNSLSKSMRATGVISPHWQKGFFDHVLRSDESYTGKWEYVRDNPVRAGLVGMWEDWPFRGEPFALGFGDSL
jgi:REP element-mobilizing transposase RayT